MNKESPAPACAMDVSSLELSVVRRGFMALDTRLCHQRTLSAQLSMGDMTHAHPQSSVRAHCSRWRPFVYGVSPVQGLATRRLAAIGRDCLDLQFTFVLKVSVNEGALEPVWPLMVPPVKVAFTQVTLGSVPLAPAVGV